MTDQREVAPRSGGVLATAPAANRSQMVAQQLRRAHEVLEAPFRAVETFKADFPEIRQAMEICRQANGLRAMDFRRSDGSAERTRTWAAQSLELLPPTGALEAIIAEANKVIENPADRAQTAALIALMIDAFPNARPVDHATYLQALIHETVVAGHSPSVLARACAAIRRTATFPPAPAEFLKACDAAKAEVQPTLRRALDALHAREMIDAAMNSAEFMGPASLEEEQREALGRRAVDRWSRWPVHLGPEPGRYGCRVPAELLGEYEMPPTPVEPPADGREIAW